MSSKKILVLGSGMVARPCVEYLARDPKNWITVASRTLPTAEALIAGLDRSNAIRLDVTHQQELDKAIAATDVVISLVPFVFHANIIKSAIAMKKHAVTTSYASPAIRALEDDAIEAGVVIINEVGVDPGVDHLYAIKTIDEVHARAGKIKEFYSYCGGLPAPEHASNPLGMKFSWSPRGVLLSQCNSASFLKDGQHVVIPAAELMAAATPYHVAEGYNFLAYPNRDSVPFQEFYNIPEAITVIRGSLRYDGNPQLTRALLKTGWLDTEAKDWLNEGMTWAQITAKLINAQDTTESSIVSGIEKSCSYASQPELDLVLDGFRWMDLLSNTVAEVHGTLIDTLAKHLEKTMRFLPGEKDLVMLQHKFVIEWSDGRLETRTSTLELFGDPEKYSGMSLSVGVTCGIATQLLLDGHKAFTTPGLVVPYSMEICEPMRELVEQEGIKLIEKIL